MRFIKGLNKRIRTQGGICGYVITGKYDFEDDCGKWVEKYIDLWVDILTVVDTEF